jgi:hypothetical protein
MKHIKTVDQFLNEQLFGNYGKKILGLLGIGDKDSAEPIDLSYTSSFDEVVASVIDNLEGGYYHPDMLRDGRVKDQRYSESGETMMGIDRKAGGSINTTPEGKAFWKIMDDQNARKKWEWNYKGGDQQETLKKLVSKMIKPLYDKYSEKYLSPEAKKIVDVNPKLLFNFIYCVWNGPGWFKKFAESLNSEVSGGNKNPIGLTKFVVGLRKNNSNKLIAQGGNKIEKLLNVA